MVGVDMESTRVTRSTPEKLLIIAVIIAAVLTVHVYCVDKSEPVFEYIF